MFPSDQSKFDKKIKIWTNNDIDKFTDLAAINDLSNILLNENKIFDEEKEPCRGIVTKQLLDFNKKNQICSLFFQSLKLNNENLLLFANDIENNFFWSILEKNQLEYDYIIKFLYNISLKIKSSLSIFPSGTIVEIFKKRLFNQNKRVDLNKSLFLKINLEIYPENITDLKIHNTFNKTHNFKNKHLDYLESESIHIIREALAESKNPVMLYSIGKDSSVMLHLAIKAFYPNKLPFPLLHIDTKWKFKSMYSFRNYISSFYDLKLIIHSNKEGEKRNINPFLDGSEIHTEIMKTQALKEALDTYKFDVAFGGARRDEEKSRAKERIFSFRNSSHSWDPKNQRPELWNIYNVRKKSDESIRVFPLSNWTEVDVWEYILKENIPIVPLYFSAPRPVVKKNNSIFLVDDDRFLLSKKDKIKILNIRFRTLGCYPLTGAIISEASSVNDILLELSRSNYSERQGRIIDGDLNSSMETKKKDGYF